MKNKSLSFKISLYISLFSLLVLGVLWVLQFVLLHPFHVRMELNELERVGQHVLSSVETDGSLSGLDSYAFEHNLRILYMGDDGSLLALYDGLGSQVSFMRLHFPAEEFKLIQQKFSETKSDTIRYLAEDAVRIQGNANSESSNQSSQKAVFVARLPESFDGYLYFSSTIPPMSATFSVLRRQFLIISVVVLLLGLAAAQWVARRLSKPIVALTNSARQLAQGNFDANFTKGINGFAETQALAQTLGYASGELSRLEQYRKDLIANISHDLKTPLTVIRMHSELIRDVCGDDEAARNRHCATIERETDWLSGMVGEVLELSKLQDGPAAFNPQPLDISALTREVLESFAALEESGECSFYPELEDGLRVTGDAACLRRVLMNLIGNAVNHTGEDKAVGVCLRREPEGVYFAVRDTGVGIAPEEIPNIWERYYKSGKTHKRAVTGTGLGLAIVREVLERHGARYGVQSEIGKGSTFWVLLRG
ncbi:MAG: HAMP domain-containing histidine kinase [Oscillospiraceae bacterium]|jgi:signal transduction histidine kinase|nr:HAMP domain-containing histidine kinase [Oscillospiraceae bacterium]